jgi:hypothetical protein
MKNAIAIVGAAAVIMLTTSAGWAESSASSSRFSYGENTVNVNDDTAMSRRAVGTQFDVHALPSNIVAMDRGQVSSADTSQFSFGENTVNLNDDTTLNRRAIRQ